MEEVFLPEGVQRAAPPQLILIRWTHAQWMRAGVYQGRMTICNYLVCFTVEPLSGPAAGGSEPAVLSWISSDYSVDQVSAVLPSD